MDCERRRYIGKRKFEAGAAEFDGEIHVEYHSFELAPDTPVDYAGTPADYMLERRGIPREQFEQMTERVTAIAASVGLDYHFDRIHQTNTIKAHELLWGTAAQLPPLTRSLVCRRREPRGPSTTPHRPQHSVPSATS